METEQLQLARWQSAMESFEGVWNRVTGTAGPPAAPTPEPAAPGLADMGEEAMRAAAYDRALACRFYGEAAALLRRHAAQAAGRASRLRAEAFIDDGVRRTGTESCPCPGNALSALRSAMLRDERASGIYARAAATADGERRALFEDWAAQTRCAAREKRALILRCFR